MTNTKTPTPLEDLETTRFADGISEKVEAHFRLRAFLSPRTPSLIQALPDPAMRAALEVLVEGLPEVIGLEAEATPGPWAWGFTGDDGNCAIGLVLSAEEIPLEGQLDAADEDWIVREPVCSDIHHSSDAVFIAATRNLIHRAMKAKEEV